MEARGYPLRRARSSRIRTLSYRFKKADSRCRSDIERLNCTRHWYGDLLIGEGNDFRAHPLSFRAENPGDGSTQVAFE